MALSGYLIKRETAANLHRRLAIIQALVDIALCRHWQWDGMRLSVRPSIVRHDDQNTTMHDKNRPATDLGIKMLFHKIYGALYKTDEWLKRYLLLLHPETAKIKAVY